MNHLWKKPKIQLKRYIEDIYLFEVNTKFTSSNVLKISVISRVSSTSEIVLGSIPGLATYFRFSFRFFKKGSCQLLAKVCARSTG